MYGRFDEGYPQGFDKTLFSLFFFFFFVFFLPLQIPGSSDFHLVELLMPISFLMLQNSPLTYAHTPCFAALFY